MTIPTTGKGLMLERMTRIFTGKGCRVHAANAFLNHVHVLVEIPNSGDFSKIVNKVKGATGTVYQKTPEYADFSGWAAGFDSFSVSFSDLHRLRRHIEEQHTIHQEISFEEVKAIIEMHGSREVVRCFSNAEIEQLLYKHLDVAIRNFNYAPVENMAVDQDAIAFRLYVTPSETQPSIRTEYGNEATKVQNLYVYCQFLTRFDPDAGPSAQ